MGRARRAFYWCGSSGDRGELLSGGNNVPIAAKFEAISETHRCR
jgi:hypothetical protein